VDPTDSAGIAGKNYEVSPHISGQLFATAAVKGTPPDEEATQERRSHLRRRSATGCTEQAPGPARGAQRFQAAGCDARRAGRVRCDRRLHRRLRHHRRVDRCSRTSASTAGVGVQVRDTRDRDPAPHSDRCEPSDG
jgi:hypothetical protein